MNHMMSMFTTISKLHLISSLNSDFFHHTSTLSSILFYFFAGYISLYARRQRRGLIPQVSSHLDMPATAQPRQHLGVISLMWRNSINSLHPSKTGILCCHSLPVACGEVIGSIFTSAAYYSMHRHKTNTFVPELFFSHP